MSEQVVEVLKGLLALPPEAQAALLQLIGTPNLVAATPIEGPTTPQSICTGIPCTVDSPAFAMQTHSPLGHRAASPTSGEGSPSGFDTGSSDFNCAVLPTSPCTPQAVPVHPSEVQMMFDSTLGATATGNPLSTMSDLDALLLETACSSPVGSGSPTISSRRSSLHMAQSFANIAMASLSSRRASACSIDKIAVQSLKGHKETPLISTPEESTQARPRSSGSILDRFKKTKGAGFRMQDILGEVSRFCLDQAGSRFLQRNLPLVNKQVFDKVFNEAVINLGAYMVDTYANYIVQIFLKHGDIEQRNRVANAMRGHVLGLSMHVFGCRVVQVALEHLDTAVAELLITELNGHVIGCANDINGNHVIQKCIQHLPHNKIGFALKDLLGSVPDMVTHPYACRVLQSAIEQPTENVLKMPILEILLANLNTLAKHAYGNYVVQYAIRYAAEEHKAVLIGAVAKNVASLGRDKYGSNVVETCISYGKTSDKATLVECILGSSAGMGQSETSPIDVLVADAYGNYVIQKLMKAVDQASLKKIQNAVDRAQDGEFVQYVSAKFQAAAIQGQPANKP